MVEKLVKIGVLDIHGSVEEHFDALCRLRDGGVDSTTGGENIEPVLVRNVSDLGRVDALILPGGESTTIGKLLRRFGMSDAISKRVKEGMPIWGTCAGAILMAREARSGGVIDKKVDGLGVMDIVVERNAYGRQLDSFETEVEFDGGNVPAVFIRAPKIFDLGDGVEILSKHKGEIIAAREGNMMVTSFHPEMTDDLSVYQYFLHLV